MPQYEVILDNTKTSDDPETYVISSADDVSDALSQALTQSSKDASDFDEAEITDYDEASVV